MSYEIPRGRRITVKTLNTKSIERAIKEVRGRKRYTEARLRELSRRLAERGEEIARQKIDEYTSGAGNGTLAQSVKVWTEYTDGKFKTYIELDTPYAAFVEFGTGIVGEQNPHPNASRRGWDYDVNDHGEEGWFYPYDPSRKHKWMVNPETGKMQPWTAGEPAKPIMYETLQQLKAEYLDIVREVFSQ